MQTWEWVDGFITSHTGTHTGAHTGTDAGGSRITRIHRGRDDEAGRITAIDRGGVITGYGYDEAGQLTSATGAGGEHRWVFDPAGRPDRRDHPGWAGRLPVRRRRAASSGHRARREHPHSRVRRGRAAHPHRDNHGRVREYTWAATGFLAALTDHAGDRVRRTRLHVDATGTLAAATTSPTTSATGSAATGDGANEHVTELWWDTAADLPTLAGIGDSPVLPLGPVTGIPGDHGAGQGTGRETGAWVSPGWRATRAETEDPWTSYTTGTSILPDGLGITPDGTLTLAGTDTPAGLPGGLGQPGALGALGALGVLGALGAVGALEWLGARPYDPVSRGFVATDPLAPVTGAGWAANPYSYAGNNPLALSDPTGLHPVSDAQLRAWNAAHPGALASAWHATKAWLGDNWEYIAAGAGVAAGAALMCTGVGGPVGLILIGAASGALIGGGASIAQQKATTGTINWGTVGKETLNGAIGGAIGGTLTAGLSALAGTAISKAGATGIKAATTATRTTTGAPKVADETTAVGHTTLCTQTPESGLLPICFESATSSCRRFRREPSALQRRVGRDLSTSSRAVHLRSLRRSPACESWIQ